MRTLRNMDTATPVRPGLPTASLAEAFGEAFGEARLATDAVFVGLFDLDEWWGWLDAAAELVDPAELARARARRRPGDRDRLVLCYALHRLLLARFLRCDAGAVPLGRDAAGCPRLAGGGLHTSLSHAGGCVAVAVAITGPVGVDIEPAARARVMPEIAGRLCHPVDLATVGALPAGDRDHALLQLWVRKEACLKAAGTGLATEMNTFPASDGAVLTLPGGGTIRARMLDAGRGWVACCAAPPGAVFEAAWIRPDRPAR